MLDGVTGTQPQFVTMKLWPNFLNTNLCSSIRMYLYAIMCFKNQIPRDGPIIAQSIFTVPPQSNTPLPTIAQKGIVVVEGRNPRMIAYKR